MSDLNKKSVEELKKLEEESRAELFALKFQAAMGKLEKPHRIGELKKQIARILTILATRKNAGENTAINVKINLNETYAKVEKESQAFAKQRKSKIEQMMAEQQAGEGEMPNLVDLPLNEAMASSSTEADEPISTKKGKASAEQKAAAANKKGASTKPSAAKKPVAAKSGAPAAKKVIDDKKDAVKTAKTDKDAALKTLINEKETAKKVAVKSKPVTAAAKPKVTVKSVTSAKAEIEIPTDGKKVGPLKTVKKSTELKAQAKLDKIKSSVAGMIGPAKGRGSHVKIDLDMKAKDSAAKEYTYGTNWKENRDKIVTTGKTTKKVDDKTAKKGTGKK